MTAVQEIAFVKMEPAFKVGMLSIRLSSHVDR
jgi:hypothetical protein